MCTIHDKWPKEKLKKLIIKLEKKNSKTKPYKVPKLKGINDLARKNMKRKWCAACLLTNTKCAWQPLTTCWCTQTLVMHNKIDWRRWINQLWVQWPVSTDGVPFNNSVSSLRMLPSLVLVLCVFFILPSNFFSFGLMFVTYIQPLTIYTKFYPFIHH